jgi:hypothetical protein
MNDLTQGHEVMIAESGTAALISANEINQQIATAKRYPRNITQFIKRATELVTMNEAIAQQCIYALPRDGKTIEGPSARMAEVIVNAWGNSRAGARVISDNGEFIVAQGVFHDLEANVAISYEVQRRITTKDGRRFGADMIGVTGNAACSIALRNAILKGVPKAYWDGIYKKARAVVAGDIQTLANKRANALKEFVIFGITEAQILAKLGKPGLADIGTDDLVMLFGLLTAIKDGDTTPEDAFSDVLADVKPKATWAPAEFDKALKNWADVILAGTKSLDDIVVMARSKAPLTQQQEAQIRALKGETK